MLISQSQEELKAAIALQAKCELKGIALRHCHASREGRESDLQAPFTLKISHNASANTILNGRLRIEARFQAHGFDSASPAALLFSVECAFDLDYEITDKDFEPLPESIAAFKDGNAIFNCWPYARELVSSLTSRMEFQVPALPFLRMVPKSSKTVFPEASIRPTA